MTFSHLQQIPKDPLFLLYEEYLADSRTNKVNLGIGIYTDTKGKPFVYPSVQKGAKMINTSNFNYDPIGGNRKFLELSGKLLFGESFDSKKMALQQSCGGTHGLAVLAEFFRRINRKTLLVGTPTWANHFGIFHDFEVREFAHLQEGKVSEVSYEEAIQNAPHGSILLLHGGSTHNPTGLNLSETVFEKWGKLLNEKDIFVLVDFAYLGFGNGLEKDRQFALEILKHVKNSAFTLSYSKNAAMYKHRLGAIFIPCNDVDLVESNLQNIIRQSISTTPGFGAEVMNIVLEQFPNEWFAELDEARIDIDERRNQLLDLLPERFQFLRECRGMFGMLGISPEQIERLKKEFAIYMPKSSRVNFGGIQTNQIIYIAESLKQVL